MVSDAEDARWCMHLSSVQGTALRGHQGGWAAVRHVLCICMQTQLLIPADLQLAECLAGC